MKTLLRLLAAVPLLTAMPALAEGEASGPGGRAMTAFDRADAKTVLGGYYDVELQLPLGGPTGSAFDLHHLVLQASSQLHQRLLFNAELEVEHGGVFNSALVPGELALEQCWADYAVNDALGLRAGVVVIPFGIVNVLHDSDIRQTTTRPLMATDIIPSTWFEPGVGLHGVIEPRPDWQLSYEGYVTQGLTDVISPTLGLRGARPGLSLDNNGNKAVSGRVALSPRLGLEAGLSGYYGAYDATGTQHLSMLGADASWVTGPFELVGEFANVLTQGGTSQSAAVPTAIPTAMDGLYVEGRYHFFPAFLDNTWLGRAGGFEHAALTAVARWGFEDTNLAAYDASDRQEAVIGLNYRPVQPFVVKLELQHGSQPALGTSTDTVWSSVAVGF